jgi:hypothetical protein
VGRRALNFRESIEDGERLLDPARVRMRRNFDEIRTVPPRSAVIINDDTVHAPYDCRAALGGRTGPKREHDDVLGHCRRNPGGLLDQNAVSEQPLREATGLVAALTCERSRDEESNRRDDPERQSSHR